MRCIHGFEENQCPTCRIGKVSIPPISTKLIKENRMNLKAENPYFKEHLANKNEFENNLMNINKFSSPLFRPLVSKPTRLSFNPSIQNETLFKKLNEFSLHKIDNFNILEKIDLKEPELDLEQKD
ncbi:MAG: hypothetical protein P8Y23_15670 [Candidatus Lokiarchaeota archaeon]|jgi:hypothetical protein